MNLPLYIAKRIYSDQGDKRKVSRPAIRIATIGVAIGLAVMIITVSVVLGFKHTIRDKVVGFGSHIQVHNIMNYNGSDPHPICANDSLMKAIESIDGVAHAERFSTTQGILKTDEDFLGVAFKGIAAEYDTTFLHKHLVEGGEPVKELLYKDSVLEDGTILPLNETPFYKKQKRVALRNCGVIARLPGSL